ncbi:hypothetical protein EIP91_003036 [Steccherinum ochraceum]|uniref:F-box domain-containing protein n=1 Tax=Steccherinum ochraceum TaxID=92696 RepID=A0A4R0REJ2_9APHY|nr:hypothetical protein EIP91_003036 [Steccherinum ochraceum]
MADTYADISLPEVQAYLATLRSSGPVHDAIWLRQEARRTMVRFVAFNTLLNGTIPGISRFPNELLLNIFAHLREATLPSNEWFFVTHVCRRWREVALGCRSLWTDIVPSKRNQFALESLRRSSPLPMTLWWHSSYKSSPDDLMIAMQNLHCRISHINYEGSGETMESLSSRFTFKLDELVTLRLAQVGGRPPRSPVIEFMIAYEDSENTRNLRTLHLDGVAINWLWALSNLKNLHTLELRCLPKETALKVRDLLCLVQSCSSSLEVLAVHSTLMADDDGADLESPVRVHLLRLRSMKVRLRKWDGRSLTLQFLSSICVPSSAELGMAFEAYNVGCLPELSRCLPHPALMEMFPSMTEVSIGSNNNVFYIRALGPGTSVSPCQLRFMKRDSDSVEWILRDLTKSSQLQSLFKNSPINTLSVSLDLSIVNFELWKPLLDAFPSLEVLSITHIHPKTCVTYKKLKWEHEESLFSALAAAASSSTSTSENFVAARLRELHFHNVIANPSLTKAAAECLEGRSRAAKKIEPFAITVSGFPLSVSTQANIYKAVSLSDVQACLATLRSSGSIHDETWLQVEACKAMTRVLAFNTPLNTTIPINRLPDELLLKIFSHLQEVTLPSNVWFFATHGPYESLWSLGNNLTFGMDKLVTLRLVQVSPEIPPEHARPVKFQMFYEDPSNAHNLRTLHLHCAKIPWREASKFSNLHTLELLNVPETSAPSLHDFLSLIKSCSSSLEVINLTFATPTDDGEDHPVGILLPRLRTLDITLSSWDGDLAIPKLLSSIFIPSSAQITMTFDEWIGPSLPQLSRCLPDPAATKMFRSMKEVSIASKNNTACIDGVGEGGEPSPFRLRFTQLNGNIEKILSDLLKTSQLQWLFRHSPVRTLSVSLDISALDFKLWQSLLGAFASLEVLSITNVYPTAPTYRPKLSTHPKLDWVHEECLFGALSVPLPSTSPLLVASRLHALHFHNVIVNPSLTRAAAQCLEDRSKVTKNVAPFSITFSGFPYYGKG